MGDPVVIRYRRRGVAVAASAERPLRAGMSVFDVAGGTFGVTGVTDSAFDALAAGKAIQ